MNAFLDFLQTQNVMAMIAATFVFLTTIFLVVKQWINFWFALLLLVFAIIAGLAISNHDFIHCYSRGYYAQNPSVNETSPSFQQQIAQVVENLQIEVESEKENLRHVMGQIEEIFNQLEAQKEKLQDFIEETTDHFKGEVSPTEIEEAPASEEAPVQIKEETPGAHSETPNPSV